MVVGVGKFGAVRTTKGRPLQAKTNSLSPWLPSLDIVTYFTSLLGDILDCWAGGLVWGIYLCTLKRSWLGWGDGTRPSHAEMEDLALDQILTNLLSLIPIKTQLPLGCP